MTQFINELRRVKFPPSFPKEEEDSTLEEEVKHLSLGSRKNLCINPKVTKLANPIAINERCLEMQRSGMLHKIPGYVLQKIAADPSPGEKKGFLKHHDASFSPERMTKWLCAISGITHLPRSVISKIWHPWGKGWVFVHTTHQGPQ